MHINFKLISLLSYLSLLAVQVYGQNLSVCFDVKWENQYSVLYQKDTLVPIMQIHYTNNTEDSIYFRKIADSVYSVPSSYPPGLINLGPDGITYELICAYEDVGQNCHHRILFSLNPDLSRNSWLINDEMDYVNSHLYYIISFLEDSYWDRSSVRSKYLNRLNKRFLKPGVPDKNTIKKIIKEVGKMRYKGKDNEVLNMEKKYVEGYSLRTTALSGNNLLYCPDYFAFLKPHETLSDEFDISCYMFYGGTYEFVIVPPLNDRETISIETCEDGKTKISELPERIGDYLLYKGPMRVTDLRVQF